MTALIRFTLLLLLFAGLPGGPLAAQAWQGAPEILNPGAGKDFIFGFVFEDANENSRFDAGETGVPGVLVTNGFEWTKTDSTGYYELPVHADMNLSVVQPSGWRVPVDHRMVPQFFYIHKEGGTGYPLRYGGLPDTGPAPEQVNFPLNRQGASGLDFSCAIVGDPQAYSNEQISFLRDGVFADIIAAPFAPGDCMIQMGDVVGDDLDLLERHLELSAMTGLKQWLV
ncbi:MAG: phosphoesterase, partial [Candidatus Cyclonatronum sp.]|uniref:metallophosphoesterase N-terminal domain-containing protein n=1 Tax=Cyclonatronum sp. TaxID=3024185 RepID=UPI0025C0ECBC